MHNQESLTAARYEYQSNSPFPHTVIEHFLDQSLVEEASSAFPLAGSDEWIHYSHFNEEKHGLTKLEAMPEIFQEIIRYLNSESFVRSLEQLTGIPNLISDPTLQGGGLHQTKAGGHLNIHADFTVHPLKRNWRRRVNLLLYLNPNWTESYEGHLELWSKDMKKCERRISPALNTCVIFNTDSDSFHGVPTPLNCPEDRTRNSIALYYYTDEPRKTRLRATNYQARPGEGFKGVLIWLDKIAIAIYTRLKGRLGFSDETISRVLAKLRRRD